MVFSLGHLVTYGGNLKNGKIRIIWIFLFSRKIYGPDIFRVLFRRRRASYLSLSKIIGNVIGN